MVKGDRFSLYYRFPVEDCAEFMRATAKPYQLFPFLSHSSYANDVCDSLGAPDTGSGRYLLSMLWL